MPGRSWHFSFYLANDGCVISGDVGFLEGTV
jgi:hypothetical protein